MEQNCSAQPTLNAQNTYLRLQLGTHIYHKAYLITKGRILHVIESYTESDKQNDRVGTGWLYVYGSCTLVIAWLAGSCGSLPCPLPQESMVHILAWKKIQIQNPKYGFH